MRDPRGVPVSRMSSPDGGTERPRRLAATVCVPGGPVGRAHGRACRNLVPKIRIPDTMRIRRQRGRRKTFSTMPEISRFFGIIVQMYYSDHDPPHFHVRYSGQKALIAIETLAVLRGQLSPRALGLVTEWAASHRADLIEDWNLARAQAELRPIAPLE